MARNASASIVDDVHSRWSIAAAAAHALPPTFRSRAFLSELDIGGEIYHAESALPTLSDLMPLPLVGPR